MRRSFPRSFPFPRLRIPLAALSCLLGAAVAPPATAARTDADGGAAGPVVRTTTGWVRGVRQDGVNRFLGIPYAAPPVGDLRWRPPVSAPAWRGVLDATEFGPLCPQTTTLGVFAGPASVDEDCLTLNVFTTRSGTEGGAQRRPVLVWIHGGGNVDGASRDYDGGGMAKGGPSGAETVVVTVNYRLGLLGFLSHPALDGEGHLSANYGILDIQEALRWVQRNIAAFGGDPARVALGGQSAGASDTGANVISPLAAGLFNRAIFQSSPTSTYPPLSTGTQRGTAFATAAGCPGTGADAAACLRSLSVAQVLQWQGTANANGPYVTGPMVDGTVIPITPQQAWTTGRFNRMPILGGNVKDEAMFGIGITEYFTGPPQTAMTADQYTAAVTRTYSGNAGPGGSPPAYPAGTADAVLAHYPLSNYASPTLAYNAVSTDPGACRALHVEQLWAQWVPTYAYQFDYRHAPYYFPPMPDFDPMAAHTIDIQFYFPLWHGGILGVGHALNANEQTLANQLTGFWTQFAKSGNPNGSGNAPWPAFTTAAPTLLSQDIPLAPMTAAQFSAARQCDFWNSILVY